MRIFDENKNKEIFNPDLEKGYLKNDKLFVAHHEAVLPSSGKFHYETVKRFSNGGVEVKKIWDEFPTERKEAYDEYEDIQIYVPYTQKEINQKEISQLKQKLQQTDYKAIKFFEGELSEEQYALTKQERKNWRERINYLESV